MQVSGLIIEKSLKYTGDLRDGSAVMVSDCPLGGSRFTSQHPHEDSQLSVTPVLLWAQAHTWYTTYIQQDIHTHEIKIKKELRRDLRGNLLEFKRKSQAGKLQILTAAKLKKRGSYIFTAYK